MTSIDATARNIRELLGGKKYTIDYFQRKYRWRQKEIVELINDLAARFLSAWKPTHVRSEVANYPTYFLGSIIVSGEGGKSSVIDGQQRLTSLSILLIWILRGLIDEDDRKQISDLIFTRQFGSNAYNLDVPERTGAMESLYRQQTFDRDSAPESVRNILDRYEDVEEHMPKEIAGAARPLFSDWLIERVHFVEIKTPSDDDGYAIFETMNDRGLPLSPTDMLKSHLLANSGLDDTRRRLNELWKARINQLLQLDKEADADAIKSWLRARHAETIRERQPGASAQDFERIGTEFHRWVREVGKRIGLLSAPDFVKFIEVDFDYYTNWYVRLQNASKDLMIGREAIFFNNLSNFTLQYPVILASLSPVDTQDVAWRKANLVATFIDIVVARRIWHNRSIDYNTMQYAMFLVMRDIRGKSLSAMVKFLRGKVEESTDPFSTNTGFGLWHGNKKVVKRFLARLTAWLDEQMGVGSHLRSFLTSSGPQGFDIEHILANDYERHGSEFANEEEFQEARNQIGALLLLPKSFNRSYGAKSYEEKRQYYLQQNTLARTLHEEAYVHNPMLRKLITKLELQFIPHERFGKRDIAARQEVYARLADTVWSIVRLDEAADDLPDSI